jgi:hypothetical protein
MPADSPKWRDSVSVSAITLRDVYVARNMRVAGHSKFSSHESGYQEPPVSEYNGAFSSAALILEN